MKQSLHAKLRSSLGGLTVVLAAACGEAPAEPAQYPVSVETMAPATETAAFLPALGDGRARLLPWLADRASADKLGEQLDQLGYAFTQRDAQAAARVIATSRAIIAAYDPAQRAGDAPELGALELVLDRAAELIGLPALQIVGSD